MTALSTIADRSEIRSGWVVTVVVLAGLAFLGAKHVLNTWLEHQAEVAVARAEAARKAARRSEARRQEQAARRNLHNVITRLDAPKGIAQLEAYANREPVTWDDRPIPYLPNDERPGASS